MRGFRLVEKYLQPQSVRPFTENLFVRMRMFGKSSNKMDYAYLNREERFILSVLTDELYGLRLRDLGLLRHSLIPSSEAFI